MAVELLKGVSPDALSHDALRNWERGKIVFSSYGREADILTSTTGAGAGRLFGYEGQMEQGGGAPSPIFTADGGVQLLTAAAAGYRSFSFGKAATSGSLGPFQYASGRAIRIKIRAALSRVAEGAFGFGLATGGAAVGDIIGTPLSDMIYVGVVSALAKPLAMLRAASGSQQTIVPTTIDEGTLVNAKEYVFGLVVRGGRVQLSIDDKVFVDEAVTWAIPTARLSPFISVRTPDAVQTALSVYEFSITQANG